MNQTDKIRTFKTAQWGKFPMASRYEIFINQQTQRYHFQFFKLFDGYDKIGKCRFYIV